MPYRLGRLRIQDPEAGVLELEGDGFAAAGEVVTLIGNSAVQRYLNMSGPEVSRAAEIAKRYRESLKGIYGGGDWSPPQLNDKAAHPRETAEAEANDLLGRDRMRRLKRLSWRVRNGDALLDGDLAEALGLTADQRSSLVAMIEANEKDSQSIIADLRAARLRGPEDLEDKGRRANEAGHERLLTLLTAEQRERFEQLKRGDS